VIEETELGSMSSPELVRTYCDYERAAGRESEDLERLREEYRTASGSILKELEDGMNKHIDNRAECSDARRRIRSMLRARREPEHITCGD
jgi:hypothetical protein